MKRSILTDSNLTSSRTSGKSPSPVPFDIVSLFARKRAALTGLNAINSHKTYSRLKVPPIEPRRSSVRPFLNVDSIAQPSRSLERTVLSSQLTKSEEKLPFLLLKPSKYKNKENPNKSALQTLVSSKETLVLQNVKREVYTPSIPKSDIELILESQNTKFPKKSNRQVELIKEDHPETVEEEEEIHRSKTPMLIRNTKSKKLTRYSEKSQRILPKNYCEMSFHVLKDTSSFAQKIMKQIKKETKKLTIY